MHNKQNYHNMFSGIHYHEDKFIGIELALEKNKVRVCMAILREGLQISS
jgi:hypothetical protein